MKWNQSGRLVLFLAAGMLLTVGCRSTSTDRIRYLEAENAKLSADNEGLRGNLAGERDARLQQEEERAKADQRARADQARLDALLKYGGERPNSRIEDLDDEPGVVVHGSEITVSSDITFQPGKATLTKNAETMLAKVAQAIQNQEFDSIRIEGHTDSDPIKKSGWASNEELSMERAKSVAAVLAHHGIEKSLMEVNGRGASDPVVANKTAGDKAKNRRVVIRLVEK
jgi:flagellar motor protein MotB